MLNAAGFTDWLKALPPVPWGNPLLGLLTLAVVAIAAQALARLLLTRGLGRLHGQVDAGVVAIFLHPRVLRRIAQIVPWLVVYRGVGEIAHLGAPFANLITNIAAALIVLFVARAVLSMLEAALVVHASDPRVYKRVQTRSIKAYVQLAQLLVIIIAVVIMIAALADRSPLIVLSGFGALSAVLMLVFQDTIRSLVAGLLIERNDMLRVGDWVEVAQAGADGDVIDIALNTVKVQNWDKTIVTVPTWRFLDESFRNWRGMRESGGRRIKRDLRIDVSSIGFLDEEQIARLGQIALIADYMKQKDAARRTTHEERCRQLGEALASLPANQRRLTNIGTFRAYVSAYLRAHPGVHPGMTQMVRQLQSGPDGVPLEIYCFASTIVWTEYEGIQSDIFDHLLAILPEFGLRLFQRPSDTSLRQAFAGRPEAEAARLS